MLEHFEGNSENKYPRVDVNIDSIMHNIRIVNEHLKDNQTLTLVTKVVAGNLEIINKIYENCRKEGIKLRGFADTHIADLKKFADLDVEKWLIREPMKNEISDLIKYVDVTFVCEPNTIKWINDVAKKASKVQKLLLTYELGDIREGTDKKNIYKLVELVKSLSNVEVYGISGNLADYGGALPSKAKYDEFIKLCDDIEKKYDFKLSARTLPNSSGIKMLLNNETDEGINNCRFGECIWCGTDPIVDYSECEIKEFKQDTFVLKSQIVEIQDKHLYPVGDKILGDKVELENNPIRRKALIAVGKEDVNIDELRPFDENIKVLGGSSDYVVLDITDCINNYKIGDIIEFKLSYFCLLKAMNTNFVYKSILQ